MIETSVTTGSHLSPLLKWVTVNPKSAAMAMAYVAEPRNCETLPNTLTDYMQRIRHRCIAVIQLSTEAART